MAAVDYTIAVAACCAVVGFMIVIVIFSIACKKKNRCRSEEKKKIRDNQENNKNNKNQNKLFWSRFASKPADANVVTINVGNSNQNHARPQRRIYELPAVQ